MVFGSASKFRIRRSHSKASYLSHRRDNDLSLPNPDHGSYKLTISPSGESLERNPLEDAIIDNKMTNLIHHHNNNNNCHNLLQRVSASLGSLNGLNQKTAESLINCNLPDVLPMTAKVPRGQRTSGPNSYIAPPDNNLKSSPPSKQKLSPPNTPRNIQQPRFSLESSLRQYNMNASVQAARVSPLRTEYVQPLVVSPKQEIAEPVISPTKESPLVSPNKMEPPMTAPPAPPIYQEPPEPTSPNKDELVLTPPLSPSKPEPSLVQFAANTICTRALSQQFSMGEESSTQEQMITKTDQACSPVHSNPGSPESIRSTRRASPLSSNNNSPVQKEIAEVQPMQRTELVLRVNSYTSDAASQTEKEDIMSMQIVKTPLLPRQKSPEELDCEELSRDFVSHLSPTDRLQGILGSSPEHKEPADYVTGLFQLEISRPINARLSPTSDSQSKNNIDPNQREDEEGTINDDLLRKKDELVSRLDRKLRVLRAEQLAVTDELTLNDKLGVTVLARVERLALASEAAKYRQHVQEVSQITGLLLGLSSRLARAENSLLSMPCSLIDKRNLELKRDKLQEQLEEAKRLKENIDKRSKNVTQMLSKYLSSEEYADYDHFINMKAKLIMDSREIANKIQLGEEQLHALSEHD